MKIRSGFVSNSSTSSFVVVIKKEHHEKVMEAIQPYIKACIEALSPVAKKFNGQDLISFGTMTTMGGTQWEEIDVEFEGDIGNLDPEDAKYESVDDYIEKAKELFGQEAILISELEC